MAIFIKISVICIVWIAVWIHAYIDGPKKAQLPQHSFLTKLSTVSLFVITLFYTITYNGISSLPPILPLYGEILVLLLVIFFGALLMVTRHKLNFLSCSDIVFGKNPDYVSTGIYLYFHHPMYINILGILVGSWFLIPTFYGILCITLLTTLFITKAYIE